MNKDKIYTDREQAWLAAWRAIVTNRHPTCAAEYADQCLKEFDSRFETKTDTQ